VTPTAEVVVEVLDDAVSVETMYPAIPAAATTATTIMTAAGRITS